MRLRRASLFAGAVVLVLLAVWLLGGGRGGGDGDAADGHGDGDDRANGRAMARPWDRARAPRSTRFNELGQPLNEDGRPIGPPPRRARNHGYDPRDLPLIPPQFDDAGDRDRFKAWWLREYLRRADIYRRVMPPAEGRQYPDQAETEKLLSELYDAGEARRPGESDDQLLARRDRHNELWYSFLDGWGTTPGSIASLAGDSQYGEMPPPPVLPPGMEDTGPPMPTATGTPPPPPDQDPAE